MLYYLSMLAERYEAVSALRMFQYVTFRAAGAAATTFLLVALLGGRAVRLLKHLQAVAPNHLAEYTPEERNLLKDKTPSMGGVLIVLSLIVASIVWARPTEPLVPVFIFTLAAMGAIGFVDDFLKVRHRSSRAGLSSRTKLVLQIVVGVTAVWWLDAATNDRGLVRVLMVPFYKHPLWTNMPLPVAVGFGALVVVAASNAVNLSDGMDGLASGCTCITAVTFAVFAYICGHYVFANYLDVPYIPGCGEVVVIAVAMAGAALGFLWHNCHPASMFMGDTGSLALGGAIGLLAVLVKQELVLIVVGGVFVMEAGSSLLQVGFFKLSRRFTGTGRRIFRCAPLHHHFQMLGWPETQIVVRFWILGLLLAGLGLATLKIR